MQKKKKKKKRERERERERERKQEEMKLVSSQQKLVATNINTAESWNNKIPSSSSRKLFLELKNTR